MKTLLKTHPLLKILNNALVDLPSPSAISLWWNFGSILGLCLGVQLVSGIFLSMHYVGSISLAFESVDHIMRDVNEGWLLRVIHANGASMFFACLYFHIGRGLYYGSFTLHYTWSIGVIILFSVMAAAFMGYVLPWGQMSFWGATVITNLFSAIPYMGPDIVNWIWGGFAVDAATLTRFFTFHFLLPFVVSALVAAHLLFLHQTGSSNPLGLSPSSDKVPFHPYFSFKDLMGWSMVLFLLFGFSLLFPWTLGDPENFIPANPLVTPVHIQPEWYFLFAYAILRAIPNKLGGVLALVVAVAVLLVLPLYPNNKLSGSTPYPVSQLLFWSVVVVFFLLTWIGARPVEAPFILMGQALSFMYFSYFFLLPWTQWLWDLALN